MHSPSIGCLIVTYNAAPHLAKCLNPLIHSKLKPRILIIDSSSTDDTIAIAKRLNIETHLIPQKDFNHGTTRELGRKLLNTEIIVMLTQDAYCKDSEVLAKLIEPIIQNIASIAYARQIPHLDAGFFECFPRSFNYPGMSEIRTLDDMARYGAYTFFCSNSCAAYSNGALDAIGGFPEVLLGEDTIVTAKLLRKGHRIAYVAESLVHHSHQFTLKQEFLRSFDTGFSRKEHETLLFTGSGDSKRGWEYAKTHLSRLAKDKPLSLPYGCAHIFAKWAGYFIGQKSLKAPLWFKKMMSSQKYYWK